MYLEKDLPVKNCKQEALRYQPCFDLRKNIAKIVAQYCMAAGQQGVDLDLFVAHETPNYFHGNLNCFLEILARLLELSIESLDTGEVCIRICHDSLHQNNSCVTELSIIITVCSSTHFNSAHRVEKISILNKPDKKSIPFKGYSALQRIKSLCSFFDGSLTLQKPA